MHGRNGVIKKCCRPRFESQLTLVPLQQWEGERSGHGGRDENRFDRSAQRRDQRLQELGPVAVVARRFAEPCNSLNGGCRVAEIESVGLFKRPALRYSTLRIDVSGQNQP